VGWRTATGAAAIANAFADAIVTQQTRQFQAELRRVIDRLQARLRALPPGARNTTDSAAIEERLAALTPLLGRSNPNYRLANRAYPPATPAWPRPVLSVVVALIGALLLGVGGALTLNLVNPLISDEEELLFGHRLAVLGRIPRLSRAEIRNDLAGRKPLPIGAREAYRTLRRNLAGAGPDGTFPRSILFVSAIDGEGKTMTAVNLAKVLATGGARVVLVDADVRRPTVPAMLGVPARGQSFGDLFLRGNLSADGLVSVRGYGELLRVLVADPTDERLLDLLEPRDVELGLERLKQEADVIIIDAPPLTRYSDALPIARAVDAVLVAVRLRHTRRDKLEELRRMLAQQRIRPVGFVVITRARPAHGYSYDASTARDVGIAPTAEAEPLMLDIDGGDSSR
jgi:Mrp family chromosome partitioning ATPase